jgi:hypothetical protein
LYNIEEEETLITDNNPKISMIEQKDLESQFYDKNSVKLSKNDNMSLKNSIVNSNSKTSQFINFDI